MPNRFSAAKNEDTARIDAIVEQRQKLLLHLLRQIDEQVPAAHQIQLGERRVQNQAVRGKDHHLADLGADSIAFFLLGEIAPQLLGRDVRGDVLEEKPLARLVDGVLVQIAGENLELETLLGLEFLHHLLENDGERIGLLPGRAASDPCAQGTFRMTR